MKLAERLAQKYRISGMILPLDSIVDEALEEAAKVADEHEDAYGDVVADLIRMLKSRP